MIPKRIIEKAIEGGWEPTGFQYATKIEMLIDGVRFVESLKAVRRAKGRRKIVPMSYDIFFPEIILDKDFWVALIPEKSKISMPIPLLMSEWYRTAQELINLILTDGDTEKFWDELLGITK